MKQIRTCALLFFLFLMIKDTLVMAEVIEAVESAEPAVIQNILSLHVPQADWTFSGTVTNESGERYIYFFEIQRNYDRFHGLATVIDTQSKGILIYEESNTLIQNPELTHWQVGSLFLRFNPINNSWVFGVKDKKKKGFNFKVDMLGLNQSMSRKQELRIGVDFLIDQTGRLNGHIQTGEGKEQFVTAKKAWFRQIWVNKPQLIKHAIKTVFCNFNGGSAFYSVSLQESESNRRSISGWRDEQGTPVAMSQFITAQQERDKLWHIHIPLPKVDLLFENLLYKMNESQQLVIGITQGLMPGFCAVNYNDIDEYPLEQARQLKEKGNG